MTVHPPINDAEFEQVKAQRNEAVGRAEVAERELAAANAAIAEELALHIKVAQLTRRGMDGSWCHHCGFSWPCHTVERFGEKS